MSEALITRAGGGSDGDVVIPVTPGYHTILVTLRDYDGKVVPNFPLPCNDGSTSYNYKTNEKGQTLYVCNSGAANIYLNNSIFGYRMIDFSSKWTNVDAPVGLTSKININMDKAPLLHEFTSSISFGFLNPKVCNLNIVGGGAGGATCTGDSDGWDWGWGGGSGYMNNYPNQNFESNRSYQFVAGAGGRYGYWTAGGPSYVTAPGAGGTSYISGTNYSAIGGSGTTGGLGNGGSGYSANDRQGENSPVNFAGGGGSIGSLSGGYPYGGRGGFKDGSDIRNRPSAGSRGGGGGGVLMYDKYGSINASNGGTGMMRIEIIN